MHIVLLGPPGSGKGTQAARIADEFNLKHLSSGDLLREAVAGRSEGGVRAEDYIEKGLLVPDEIMLELIRGELSALGNSGWILDGFPRTLAQAEALKKMLDEWGQVIDRVILIDFDTEAAVRRLANRRICPECNLIYNMDTLSTVEEDRCDNCGAILVRRSDDEEETIRQRLKVYEEQTEQVIDFYRKLGGLITISGAGGIEEITAEIIRVVK
jgi:adenylate kinase